MGMSLNLMQVQKMLVKSCTVCTGNKFKEKYVLQAIKIKTWLSFLVQKQINTIFDAGQLDRSSPFNRKCVLIENVAKLTF